MSAPAIVLTKKVPSATDASFQNKVHLAMTAKGFGATNDNNDNNNEKED